MIKSVNTTNYNMVDVSKITSGEHGAHDFETIKSANTARQGAADSDNVSHEISNMLPASVDDTSPVRKQEMVRVHQFDMHGPEKVNQRHRSLAPIINIPKSRIHTHMHTHTVERQQSFNQTLQKGDESRFKNLDLHDINSPFSQTMQNDTFKPNTSCQPQFNTQRGERNSLNPELNGQLPNITNISIGGQDKNSSQIVSRGIRAGNMAQRGPIAAKLNKQRSNVGQGDN